MCIKYRKTLGTIAAGIFVLALLILRMKYGIVIVDGESMASTLHNRQIVLIQRDISSLGDGDIVVFDQDNKRMIKRIVASSGDTVELSDELVKVNDIVVRPYSYEGSPHLYTLGDNEYFVIGDNYLNSYDSRDFGPITKSQIAGEVKQ